jgi:hypothetical protein
MARSNNKDSAEPDVVDQAANALVLGVGQRPRRKAIAQGALRRAREDDVDLVGPVGCSPS